ncbi:hypothetical protein [Ideonella sp. A 288]|uniref:hypothetical protein n=1 Tax=Ideonella sp. A 288 TaxID=1962181 RepID=UPI000B4B3DBF|nr:hypothetical protein [Ideonella sp. A 288]
MKLEYTATCRKCGHEHQGPGPRVPDDAACPACGAVYAKVDATLAARESLATRQAAPKVPLTWARMAMAVPFGLCAVVVWFIDPSPLQLQLRSSRPDIVNGLVQGLGLSGARWAISLAFGVLCIAILVMRPSTADTPQDDGIGWPRRPKAQGGVRHSGVDGEWNASAMAGIWSLAGVGLMISLLTLNLGVAMWIIGVALALLLGLLAVGLLLSLKERALFFDPESTWQDRPFSFAIGWLVAAGLLAAAWFAFSRSS